MARDPQRQRPSERMATGLLGDDGEPDRFPKEESGIPPSPTTIEEATAILNDQEMTQPQTPEQRHQAAAQAAATPAERARLVAAEGNAHPPLGDDENPGERMARTNEALSLIARELESNVVSGAFDGELRAAQAAQTPDEAGLRAALKWALLKLTHPAEQMDFCIGHGKVPVTHMCSMHRNEDYAHALRVAAGVLPHRQEPETDVDEGQ